MGKIEQQIELNKMVPVQITMVAGEKMIIFGQNIKDFPEDFQKELLDAEKEAFIRQEHENKKRKVVDEEML